VPDRPDLSLVVPVYNEAATIATSLQRWLAAFERARISAECVVVDDGSTDATAKVLAGVARAEPRVRVLRQPNAGHGAAVVTGYRAAVGAWVLQIDGDDEIGDTYFPALWAERTTRGLVLGRRAQGHRAPVRRLISALAAARVRWTSGAAVADANVPYRVLPRVLLLRFLEALPPGVVAPNLAMTLYAGTCGWEVREVPVVERVRDATRRPLGGARLWRTAVRAWRESRAFRKQLSRQSRRS